MTSSETSQTLEHTRSMMTDSLKDYSEILTQMQEHIKEAAPYHETMLTEMKVYNDKALIKQYE